jgi:hypothetical protein
MTAPHRSAESVLRWFGSAGHHQQPELVQERYLEILFAFCTHRETTPDELVAFCYLRRRVTGERFVSVKRRTTVNEWLDEFVSVQGWTGKEAVVNANVVRGFLIHNGILIQGRAWTGPP